MSSEEIRPSNFDSRNESSYDNNSPPLPDSVAPTVIEIEGPTTTTTSPTNVNNSTLLLSPIIIDHSPVDGASENSQILCDATKVPISSITATTNSCDISANNTTTNSIQSNPNIPQSIYSNLMQLQQQQQQQQQQQHENENENDSQSKTEDVEKFGGKIVYNPDGSAYIIEDGDLSDDDSILTLPKHEGSIVERVGMENSPENKDRPPYPQIANAIYVSRSAAYYNALYGQAYAKMIREKMGGQEAPIVHSYRVYSMRDGCKEEASTIDPPLVSLFCLYFNLLKLKN